MAGEIQSLTQALATKEEQEKLLAKLEKLKAEGSVEPDVYLSLKADYQQKLDSALLEIDRIKVYFKKQRDTLQRELDTSRYEMNKLETKNKVGELPLETYQNSSRSLRSVIEQMEQQLDDLNRFIAADSPADFGLPTKKAPVTAETTIAVLKTTVTEQKKPPQRKWLAIGGGVLVFVVIVVITALLLIPKETATIKEVKIPVDIKGATNIGSLHFELVYDATKLNHTSIIGGTLLGNAIFKNSGVPGKVVCGMVSSSGIKGDGSVVVVTFQVLGKDDTAIPLALEKVAAYDGTSLNRLSLSTLNGSFSPKDGSFTAPVLVFQAASK